MSDPIQPSFGPAPSSGGSGVKIAILFGAVIALLAANVYLFLQIDKMRVDMAKMQEQIMARVSTLQETAQVSTQTSRQNLDTLRDELEAARRQAALAAGQAKVEAQKHAEDLAKRLESEQKRAAQAVKQEITEVRQETATAQEKIGQVGAEVGTVKTEVANTKSELDKTIADLKRVTGDLGVTSGLVATNGKEIAALRALGERNIYEFNLTKTKQPVKIGDISVQLKKTDQKKNKYTIEVWADDKKVEKKDKNVNEPVQFYTSKARQPYEIVVNEVKKDIIVGYLSTPKVQQQRTTG